MVNLKYHFTRKYADAPPDGLGRAYTDGSRWLLNRLRGIFLKGQQLWDDDLNNVFKVWELWRPRDVIYRKYMTIKSRPPYYSPIVQSYVVDPKHMNPPDDNAANVIYYYATGMQEPYWLPPLPGQLCYVKADRNVVAFTGVEWLPLLKFDDRNVSVEIAFFFGVKSLKQNAVVAVYRVDKPFAITARSANWSRSRGINDQSSCTIRKNGVDVAKVYVLPNRTRLKPIGDTVFQAGDRLEVFMTETANFASTVELTIMGDLLSE